MKSHVWLRIYYEADARETGTMLGTASGEGSPSSQAINVTHLCKVNYKLNTVQHV